MNNPAIRGSPTEKDIVGGAQFGNEIEFLMNDRHARGLGIPYAAECAGAPIDPDDALVLRLNSSKDFHQRALAGAILAHQRVHFAVPELEVDLTQRSHAAKFLEMRLAGAIRR
jgi:hypothetical protein